jgi:ABC-2 type transport system ATP-binding protein
LHLWETLAYYSGTDAFLISEKRAGSRLVLPAERRSQVSRLRPRSALAAVAAVVAVLAAAAPAAQARDAEIRSFDGTRISLHLFPAAGLPPGGRAPTVLVGPGFGSPGDTDQESASSEITGNVGLGPLRRAGYNVVTWDPRGFGRSGGQVEVDHPDYEARDVQAIIDWLALQPEARLDRAGDPRVGMSGGSYGGGVQWITAARDARVDVIVPNISWNSLITSLYKDGALKAGWGSVLCGVGTVGSVPGGLVNPDGVQPSRLNPHMLNTCVNGIATGSMAPDDQAWFAAHGPDFLLPQVKVPTLITQGTVDTLFTLDEAVRNYRALRARNVPVKMMWFCGGHGACLSGSGPAGHVEAAVLGWLARHLKRDTSVATGPRFEWLADDARWRSAADYPLPAAGSLSATTGLGTLAVTNSPSGGAIAAAPAANAVELTLPAATAEANLLGAPTLKLTYRGLAAPAQTHLYAQLVDVATNRVVGNHATPIPVTLDGVDHTIQRPLEVIAARTRPGSTYRLQITPATTLYTPQRSAGTVSFPSVSVSLPVVS